MTFKKVQSLVCLLMVAGLVGWFNTNSPTLFAQTSDGQSKEITIIHEDDREEVITVKADENKTIAILKEMLKGSSDEEIDAYFTHYESDDQRILADDHGGLMSLQAGYEGDGDLGYVVNNDGTETHYNLNSPDATTVGEAKEALKAAND